MWVTGCARCEAVASGLLKTEEATGVHITVRATTLLNLLLDLPGITVRGVSLSSPDQVVVEVRLPRRRMQCPVCGWSTGTRYDRRPVWSRWRRRRPLGIPMCSISREPRREECTTCTALAPEAVFTVRTYATTTPQPRDHDLVCIQPDHNPRSTPYTPPEPASVT